MAPQRITLLLIKDQTKHKNIKLSFKEYFDISVKSVPLKQKWVNPETHAVKQFLEIM